MSELYRMSDGEIKEMDGILKFGATTQKCCMMVEVMRKTLPDAPIYLDTDKSKGCILAIYSFKKIDDKMFGNSIYCEVDSPEEHSIGIKYLKWCGVHTGI